MDARSLSIETQEYLRQQAIHLRQQGQSFIDIGGFLGVHRNTVGRWWQEYEVDGDKALQQRVRGRALGEQRRLTPTDEVDIQELILSHFPEELDIDSALWSRRAVPQLIEHLTAVKLPIRPVGEYLKRWGYTPQKPLKRAYEQDPKAVEAWLEQTYPAIVQRAQQEGAEIAWGDESGLRSDDHTGRGYAPAGDTPAILLSQKQRFWVNFIASMSRQGHIQFMLYTSTVTAQVFLVFLQRLMAKRERKLFWIIDRHPVHQAQRVQPWLAEHSQPIEVFYLPSYSPQLNPVEYLNGDVKQGVHSKSPSRNLNQLKGRVLSHLRKLQKLPQRILSYFKHPLIAYASQQMHSILLPG
jgi:transposase